MKYGILVSFFFIASMAFSQKIKFKIAGQKDTTVNLVKYLGKKLYYADTAEMKNGVVEFDGSKQKEGMLALFLPGQKMLEFIKNDEDLYIESDVKNLMKSAVVKKGNENKAFLAYALFVSGERNKASKKVKERDAFDKESDDYKKLDEELSGINQGVLDYQNNLIEKFKDDLLGKMIKMSLDVEVPEAPKNPNGSLVDSNFRFNYFRTHYFDNIDFNDDRLVKTPIFHNKVSKYFGNTMMVQHWDTIIKYAFDLCDRLPNKGEMFQYCVNYVTTTFDKSKIMGMDKVVIKMGEKYYCTPQADGKPLAFWMPKENLDKFCERVNKQKNLVMGATPPNLRLRDTSDKVWRDYYSLKSDYTILYFWDPECGHCKKITPKMQTLYAEKLKARNVEIFAVGKATDADFEKWKAFIKKHNLEFINVALTKKLFEEASDKSNDQAKLKELLAKYTTIESLNYQQAFDIFALPKVWILDKDKKIIAKSLSISQIEEFLDKLQGFEDSEKLFPIEEQDADEEIH